MRIVSYNVNGIRAAIKKGLEEKALSLSPDVLFIQETKLSDDSMPLSLPGYHCYSTHSKVRKGYSGTAVFVREEPVFVHYGLENGEYDDEGRIITLEYPSFYLVGAYVPNSGEGLKRLSFRMDFEDAMRAYLNKLSESKPLVYCGDLNVAHEEIDIKNPKANIHNAGFTMQERNKMSELLSGPFVDAFRYLYPDKVAYSWWSYRFHAKENDAGWRIDCFIVSDSIKDKIKSSSMAREFDCSDHCPIILDIDLQ